MYNTFVKIHEENNPWYASWSNLVLEDLQKKIGPLKNTLTPLKSVLTRYHMAQKFHLACSF